VDDIVLTRSLRDQGFDSRELGRMRRDGSLIPYAAAHTYESSRRTKSREDKHRDLIFATAPQLYDGAVISHGSAAVLHGLPTWPNAIDRVHVTRNRNSGGNRVPLSRCMLRRCLTATSP
jgi:hypothetical protein